jgi:lambda family phage tail tape measure protein
MADYLIRIVATDATDAAVSSAKQKMESLGTSTKKSAAAMKEVADSAKLTKNELLTLNYTLSDVAASLSSGASPFTILMQQGGQVKDSFGGFGPMMSKFAGVRGPVGLAVGGVAVALGSVAVAYEKGASQSRDFAKAMQATGGYAQMTESSYRAMSASVAELTRTTQSASMGNVLSVIGTGRFTPDEIRQVTVSAAEMSRRSGQSFADVVSSFASMREKVADNAAELNKQYHFLTTAQYEQIASMEDAGNKSGAFKTVLDLLTGSVKEQKENVGFLEQGWRNFKGFFSEGWNFAASIGREKTDADQVAEAYKNLQSARELLASKKSFLQVPDDSPKLAGFQRYVDQAQAAVDALLKKYNEAQSSASATASKAQAEQKGINASRYFDGMDTQFNKAKALEKELAQLKSMAADKAAAGSPISDADYATYEKNIRKKFQTPDQKAEESAAQKLQNAFEKQRDKLGEESQQVTAQIAQWDKYGDTINHARVAETEFLVTAGKLKDLDFGKKAELLSQAMDADANAAKLSARKDYSELAKKVQVVQAEADATDTSARATQEAALMAQLNTIKNRIDADQYNSLAAAIKKANDARADKNVIKALKDQNAATDEQIRKLKEENELIGKTSLEKSTTSNTRSLESKRDQMIRNDPSAKDTINADFSDQIKRSNAAITENYNMSRTWDAGWKNAFASYKENATNAANDAQAVFGTVTGGMETMIVDFVTTGKASFGDFARSVLSTLAKIAAQKMVMSTMSYFGFGTGHDGAVVGESYTGSKTVSASAFTGAPRFHTGGITGDEVPVIAKKGEGIFTQAQMKKLAPVGGAGATVNVTLNVVEDSSRAGETEQSQSDSGVQLTAFVKQIKGEIAGDIASGSGTIPKALESTYSLSRKAV